jgi:Zn finger protein HypA/HybF involved in hydrogenase expression
VKGHKVRRSRLKRMPEIAVVGDGNGGKATLISTGLVKATCQDCGVDTYAESNVIQFCGSCGSQNITKVWMRPQTVLVPESEASFLVYQAKGKG